MEPDVNADGPQVNENPFWRNAARPLDTVVSQTPGLDLEKSIPSLEPRNASTTQKIQLENSFVNPNAKRNIIKPRAAINNGVTLRIMVLGASIASGEGSSDLNGFRYGLRNALVAGGNPVNVGSLFFLIRLK